MLGYHLLLGMICNWDELYLLYSFIYIEQKNTIATCFKYFFHFKFCERQG